MYGFDDLDFFVVSSFEDDVEGVFFFFSFGSVCVICSVGDGDGCSSGDFEFFFECFYEVVEFDEG